VGLHRLFENTAFHPDHVAVMVTAYEAACADLGLKEPNDPLRNIVARAIIEAAQNGERNAICLQECAHEAMKD
jgi:hypothetical protein